MFAKISAKLRGYRTMISSALITLASGISAIPDLLQSSGISWQTALSQEIKDHAQAIIMAVAIFFGFMRWITTTPVGTPEPPAPGK
jgi:sulfite exporter TauE/SafE